MSATRLFFDLGILTLVAAAFWLVYYLVQKTLHVLPLQQDTRTQARRAVPLFGLLLCLAFAIVAARTLFKNQELIQSLAILTVIAAFAFASQRLLRDYFAGVAVIAEQSCRVGDQVRALGMAGKVIELGTRGLSLESQQGDRAFLPYSRLIDEPIVITKHVETGSYAHKFSIPLPEQSLSELYPVVIRVTQAHHWSALARLPELDIVGDRLDITVYALCKTHVLDIEGAIKRHIERP